MVDPAARAHGLSGTQGRPITVRALHEGAVTIDGQFRRIPVRFRNNSWWVIEGINVKNGTGEVIALQMGSNDNVFRRIVAWDAAIDGNTNVVGVHGSLRNLFEDVAMFGTARKIFSGSQGGNFLTCRRCWMRWEGSTHSVGGITTVSYNSEHYTCESCLLTYSGESMPESYTSSFSGRSRRDYELDAAAGYQMQDGASPVGCKSVSWLGSITYIRSGDRTTLPGSGILSTFYRLIDCVTVVDSIFAIHPRNGKFSSHRGIDAAGAANVASVSFKNVTTLAGRENLFGDNQTRINVVASTSKDLTENIPTVFSGGANPWTGAIGAQVCKQYKDGALTATPLWPWPMNDRIRVATRAAGAYSGPCPGCDGGRHRRIETDVTVDIEKVFGAIPPACKRS